MMHIRLLHEVFFIKPHKNDFHTIDLIDEPVWTEFLQAQGNEIKRLLTRDDKKETIIPSWSDYSGRVAHLAKRREKGHETPAANFLGDLKFLLPYVERYLEAVKAHLLLNRIEPVSTPFEKWYIAVRKNDPNDARLLSACFDAVSRFKAIAKD
jgi:hypothetical protein